MTWREVVPLPSRLWVRHLPRRWPEGDLPRLDLVEHRIAWPPLPGAKPLSGERLPAVVPLADMALLPPIGRDRTKEKADLVLDLIAARVPVLNQFCAGEDGEITSGATQAADLLSAMLSGDLSAIDDLPEQAWIIVPLLPGLSSATASWDGPLQAIARRKPLAVVGVAPELSPSDRRRLVEHLGEEHFEAVHHAAADEAAGRRLERDFAAAVARAGLPAFAERPAMELPPRRMRNRALATLVAECGELWLRVGRSEAEGAALLAAARHFESVAVAGLDLAALSREGNLSHLGFLSPLALEIVASAAEGASRTPRRLPPLLVELRDEFLAGGRPA